MINENFKITQWNGEVYILDDFFADPNAIREMALKEEYSETKKAYPGHRTVKTYEFDNLFDVLKKRLNLDVEYQNLPCFRKQTINDLMSMMSCHIDGYTDKQWSLVVYMSKDEDIPEGAGTSLFKFKETGKTKLHMPVDSLYEDLITQKEFKAIIAEQTGDPSYASFDSLWEKVGHIDMKFNRAALFHANLFHGARPREGFGDCDENARFIYVTFLIEK